MRISTGRAGWIPFLAAVGLVLVWQIGARGLGAPIILPSPLETLNQLGILAVSPRFYRAVGATALRGLWGFLLPLAAACITGVLSGRFDGVRAAMKPFLTVIKSTPVMSVILLAMIWFPKDGVPIFVCFLTTFPILTEGIGEGVRRINSRYLELARVYGIRGFKLLRGIYLPAVLPFLLASVRSTLGLTWKVIVAAELLSQPRFGIGSGMQSANVNLQTAEVFSWTLIAVLLSWGSGILIDLLIRRLPGAAYETR